LASPLTDSAPSPEPGTFQITSHVGLVKNRDAGSAVEGDFTNSERRNTTTNYVQTTTGDDSSSSSGEGIMHGARAVPGVYRSHPNLDNGNQGYTDWETIDNQSSSSRDRPTQAATGSSENDPEAHIVEAELVQQNSIVGDPVVAVKIERKKKKWVFWVFFLILIIGGVVVGVVAVVVGNKPPNQPISSPAPVASSTGLPTPDPTPLRESHRFEALLDLIGSEIADDLSQLRNRDTVQYQALEWLANVDPAQLDVYDETVTATLIERYVILILYFQSGVLTIDFWNSTGFLSALPVCDWHENGDEWSKGIKCNGTGVSEIRFCEYMFIQFCLQCICCRLINQAP
jgi:hypothetical protein